ncbi:hypothetical protein [Streptomyces sp. NPDC056061]|uniref:hypothetical protein n=1 Tax=Streptomyces sp. NPDC056061 TaxID=3345700 RepID=UPI0035DC4140
MGELAARTGWLAFGGVGVRHDLLAMVDTSRGDAPANPAEEPRGCLFALSQPPLMIFLGVIGGLLLMAAVHDLFML